MTHLPTSVVRILPLSSKVEIIAGSIALITRSAQHRKPQSTETKICSKRATSPRVACCWIPHLVPQQLQGKP